MKTERHNRGAWLTYQVIKHIMKLRELKPCVKLHALTAQGTKPESKNKFKHTCLVQDKDGISYTEE